VAEAPGTVAEVLAEAGTQVAADDLLLAIDVADED
jgi:biotin carboxyl carrier protein